MHFLLTCTSRRWKLLLPSWPRPRRLLPSPGSLREETWPSSSSPGRTNWKRENREKVVIRQDVEVINTPRWSVIWAGVVTWRSPRGRTPPYEYSHWQSWRGTASGIKFSSDTDWSSAPEEWSNKHKLLNPHSDSGWLTMKWKTAGNTELTEMSFLLGPESSRGSRGL